MAKFSVKSIVNLSKLDLKKASVDANNRLKKQNDNLSFRIKDAEELVKSKEKELKDFDKQLKAKVSEIDASDKYITKLRADVYSFEKESSKLNEVIKKLKGDESSWSKNIKKLESMKGELEDAIAGLEIRKQKADKIVKDMGSIETRKSVAQSDLDILFKQIGLAENELENAEENRDSFLKNFKQEKDDLRVETNSLVIELDIIKSSVDKANREKDNTLNDLDEDIAHKSSELEAVNSLVNKAEDEYIAWNKKIKKAEGLVETENRKIQTTKDAFEKWKIAQLEQVAKMKLKNKLDNIDKAGLSEILGNG